MKAKTGAFIFSGIAVTLITWGGFQVNNAMGFNRDMNATCEHMATSQMFKGGGWNGPVEWPKCEREYKRLVCLNINREPYSPPEGCSTILTNAQTNPKDSRP